MERQSMFLKEISIMLGISLPLVKYRIKRAKKILEKLMEGEDYDA